MEYASFLGIFGLSLFVLTLVKLFLLNRLEKYAQKTTTTFDDFLIKVADVWDWKILTMLAFYVATQFLSLSDFLLNLLNKALLVVIGAYLIRTFYIISDYSFSQYIVRRQKVDEHFDPTIILFFKRLTHIGIVVLIILMVLQNMGYQVTALIGGLGIGGIAIAFAVQNLLADVFSSFSIYFDKPFKLGDFVVTKTDSGVIKKIGIKSTRIKTLQGEELVVSNKELTETRIRNFKQMQKRRIVFTIGVPYETPVKKIKAIPEMIKEIIEEHELADLDRAHLKTLGDSALIFEVVYFVNTSDYNVYMDIQQSINLALLESFAREKIGFAYPSQTVFLKK